MITLEKMTVSVPTVDQVGSMSYDSLLSASMEVADSLAIDRTLANNTFEILEEIRIYDEEVALGGLRTMPIALEIANSIADFYHIEIDEGAVFSASLLHDVGKIALPKELLEKSNAGIEWTWENALDMRRHISLGGTILRKEGYPMEIVRPIEEHHHKQIGNNEYGINPNLANQERIYRDSIAIGDFIEADINRTNSRNKDKNRLERESEIAQDITYVLEDYNDSTTLSSIIFRQSLKTSLI